MKEGSAQTLCYSLALGTICAVLLTGVGRVTAPYREANEAAEKMRNILTVLAIPYDEKASSKELIQVFEKNVQAKGWGGLKVYRYQPTGEGVRAVAVPFSGPGLWGPIDGYLALEPDMKTIRGVTFYKQEETPGLGGLISSTAFTDRFKGKSIQLEDGKVGIVIRRAGTANGVNEVDAITGATLTCDKVQSMLNGVIDQIVKERSKDGQ